MTSVAASAIRETLVCRMTSKTSWVSMLLSVCVSAKIAIAVMAMLTTTPSPFRRKPLSGDFVDAIAFGAFIRSGKQPPTSQPLDSRYQLCPLTRRCDTRVTRYFSIKAIQEKLRSRTNCRRKAVASDSRFLLKSATYRHDANRGSMTNENDIDLRPDQ